MVHDHISCWKGQTCQGTLTASTAGSEKLHGLWSSQIALCAQKLAKELKRRLQQYAPYGGNPIMLSQATWALSQVMREDAPWQELFLLIGTALMQSNESIPPGPASAVLKAAATYKVLHGESPLPPDILDFMARNLLVTDSRSVGPQVCFVSQYRGSVAAA